MFETLSFLNITPKGRVSVYGVSCSAVTSVSFLLLIHVKMCLLRQYYFCGIPHLNVVKNFRFFFFAVRFDFMSESVGRFFNFSSRCTFYTIVLRRWSILQHLNCLTRLILILFSLCSEYVIFMFSYMKCSYSRGICQRLWEISLLTPLSDSLIVQAD